jgi:hypothetical protein
MADPVVATGCGALLHVALHIKSPRPRGGGAGQYGPLMTIQGDGSLVMMRLVSGLNRAVALANKSPHRG